MPNRLISSFVGIAALALTTDSSLLTAGAVDAGEKPAVISAIAKYHMTERARKVVERHAPTGCVRGFEQLLNLPAMMREEFVEIQSSRPTSVPGNGIPPRPGRS